MDESKIKNLTKITGTYLESVRFTVKEQVNIVVKALETTIAIHCVKLLTEIYTKEVCQKDVLH